MYWKCIWIGQKLCKYLNRRNDNSEVEKGKSIGCTPAGTKLQATDGNICNMAQLSRTYKLFILKYSNENIRLYGAPCMLFNPPSVQQISLCQSVAKASRQSDGTGKNRQRLFRSRPNRASWTSSKFFAILHIVLKQRIEVKIWSCLAKCQ